MTPFASGWLPAAIGLDRLSQRAVVRWLEFGSAPLAEPFFVQTVERLRRAIPPPREAQSDLESVLKAAEDLPPVTPSGFVFHVSHCGSTLIANALKTADRAAVVSEAPPLSILLHPDSCSFAPQTDAWDEMRESLFRALISLFAHYRGEEAAHLVIKFPSWNIRFWSTVRSYWPEVPAIAVIRDPVEVISASLGGGGWMEFKRSPELAGRLFGWENLPRSVDKMSGAEFAARVLRSFYQCACEMADQGARIVDYEDLDIAQVRAIAAFFKVELPASRLPLERIFGVYSKDPAGAQPFQPDRPRKQKLATGLVRSAAHQWAIAAYRDARRRC